MKKKISYAFVIGLAIGCASGRGSCYARADAQYLEDTEECLSGTCDQTEKDEKKRRHAKAYEACE